jgi:hypothetical protein
MHTPEEPRIGKILQSWKVTPRADPTFGMQVYQRLERLGIERGRKAKPFAPFRLFRWVVLAMKPAGALAIFLLLVLGLPRWLPRSPAEHLPEQVREHYQVVLLPEETARNLLAGGDRFESIHRNALFSHEEFETALEWIERQVSLDPSQTTLFHQAHASFFENYRNLCELLIAAENDYRQLERDRIAGKPVDLFEVYHHFEQQQRLYQQTILLQRQLVQEVYSLLTPKQRDAFGQLLESSQPLTPNPAAEAAADNPRAGNI